MSLENFLNPKSIAIIGASEHKDKVGYALMENLDGFKGKIVPINPKHSVIFGLKSYRSVLDYRGKIDLCIIAVPAKFVAGVLNECGRKGIKSVIVISSGFSEQGNVEEEKKILKVAKKYGIRILGPNCFGIANPYVDMDTTFSRSYVKKGGIAFISQSGALWSYISDFASANNIGFSGYVSLGNMSDLEFSDFIEYFSKDRKTKYIVLYVEKLKKGKRFLEVVKKCKKSIYVVKAGSSKEGSEAAFSHTGSLATDYEIYKGIFKQGGVVLKKSLVEILQLITKKKFSNRIKKLKIKEATIVTNAGGAGALASDYLSNSGVKVKGTYDILGTAVDKDYKKALVKYGCKDTTIVILTPQTMSHILETAQEVINFKKKTKKKIVGLFLGGKVVKKACMFLEKNGISCFNTLEEFRKSL